MPVVTRSQNTISAEPLTKCEAVKKAPKNHTKCVNQSKQKETTAKWLKDRAEIMVSYKDHPVCLLLRNLKTDPNNTDLVNSVLFYLGELSDGMLSARWCVDLPRDTEIVAQLIKIFCILCPNTLKMTITNEYYTYGVLDTEIIFEWKDIDPIAFNDHVFPDYSCVDKKTLVF